ncbi:cytochrome P450 [Allonocardiopsis opalescens]|uniref:Pentalenolactone synthase n=1 Tax=Allonocardiopsis opalescens TaxID=1144618 RepID=A0A2T0Q2A6_9ACTN|nr:cytochrome P450 [Allonocardiopsis opalescens]PRX97927.1 pentalenolactone synthase [Allonocardiopsis opalescens]
MTPGLPFPQDHPLQFPPALRTLREAGPLHRVRTRTGDDAWLVTGYAEVRALLADPRLGRAHPDPAHAARSGASALFGGPQGDFATEHADHARMRSLLRPHFTPGRIRALAPRVAQLTEGLLDELARLGPPADLVTALAVPLPILVICELLGVPYEDRTRFRAWSEAAADVTDQARSEQGLAELFDYGMRLVAAKRRRPGEDVISALAAVDGVGDGEIAGLSMALLFAGHETTVVQIGMGALLLLTRPDRWRRLAEHPEDAGAAVEEMLRAAGKGGGGIPRYARTDIELAGETIAAGDLVMCDNGAANHDPSVFEDPDRFDPDRRGPAHLSFGHGARYCIGAPLARLELQAVFSRLPARFPAMKPVGELEQTRVRADTLTGGLAELPVAW